MQATVIVPLPHQYCSVRPKGRFAAFSGRFAAFSGRCVGRWADVRSVRWRWAASCPSCSWPRPALGPPVQWPGPRAALRTTNRSTVRATPRPGGGLARCGSGPEPCAGNCPHPRRSVSPPTVVCDALCLSLPPTSLLAYCPWAVNLFHRVSHNVTPKTAPP